MTDDRLKHGLFEDSEDSSSDDQIPSHLTIVEEPAGPDESEPEPVPQQLSPSPRQEVQEEIHQYIDTFASPIEGSHMVICKLPPSVALAASPFNEAEERNYLKENPNILDEPPNLDASPTIRWRVKQGEGGEDEAASVLETNTHLVEWDDGSHTLFIGNTPLTVDYRKETVFLLEDSNASIKPVHAVITERMQTKFTDILRNKFTRSKENEAKKQRVALTSIADAMSSRISIQQRRLATRENERMRRVQQNSIYRPRGLTRQFLEDDDASINP